MGAKRGQKELGFQHTTSQNKGFFEPFYKKPEKHPLNVDITTITRKLSGATPRQKTRLETGKSIGF